MEARTGVEPVYTALQAYAEIESVAIILSGVYS